MRLKERRILKNMMAYTLMIGMVFATPLSSVFADETEEPQDDGIVITASPTDGDADVLDMPEEETESITLDTIEEDKYVSVLGENEVNGLSYYITDDGAVITGYSGDTAYVNIPSTIDGHNVVGIDDAAFKSNTDLKEVTIPDSVVSIGMRAFYDCSSLEKVTMSSKLTSLGYAAFENCRNLTAINIPIGVTTIETYTFYRCEKLRIVSLSSRLTNIKEQAFYGCKSLDEIIIPGGVEEIYSEAFCGCEALTKVTLQDGVSIIGTCAFSGCSSLVRIEIPGSVSYIGGGAFENCTDLRTVTIKEGVRNISYGAFSGCEELTSVTIPNGIKEIDKYAFSGCSKLESVVIPGSIIEINEGTFKNCTGLKDVTIKDGVVVMSCQAFSNCSSLTKITIPESLSYIYGGAFDGCDNLTDVYYNGTKEQWGKIDISETNTVFDSASIHFRNYINDTTISLSATSYTYDGKAKKPSVTVKDGTTTLVKGTDYTVSYKDSKGNAVASPINADTYSVVVTGIGSYEGTAEKTFIINPKAVTPTVTLSGSAYTYNGKVRKPIVTVKDGTKTLTTDDYAVKYKTNKDVGRAYVTVTLKGNYSGTKNASFKINPKGTTVSTLTAASKAFTAKWTKQSEKMSTSYITGYQIQYATDKSFTKNKGTVTVKGYSTTGKKVTGLKAKTTYYVRIRTYKTVNGTDFYSTWSSAKTVKTK